MSSRDPAAVIAERLGLPPARDSINEPWRYWLLRYLAALCDIADYEGTHFGRVEARAALEALADDLEDVLKILSPGRVPRRWRPR